MQTGFCPTLIALAVVTACSGNSQEQADKPMAVTQAFANIPIPPGGVPLDAQGGGEAAQLLISTPVPADSIVAYYRKVLSAPPYQLLNESTAGDTTTFYVTSGSSDQPMWVGVERLTAGGTMVRLVGAAVPKADSGSSTDSTAGT